MVSIIRGDAVGAKALLQDGTDEEILFIVQNGQGKAEFLATGNQLPVFGGAGSCKFVDGRRCDLRQLSDPSRDEFISALTSGHAVGLIEGGEDGLDFFFHVLRTGVGLGSRLIWDQNTLDIYICQVSAPSPDPEKSSLTLHLAKPLKYGTFLPTKTRSRSRFLTPKKALNLT